MFRIRLVDFKSDVSDIMQEILMELSYFDTQNERIRLTISLI